MEKRRTPNQEFYVPKTNVPPNAGQIAAAKLIMKRHREAKAVWRSHRRSVTSRTTETNSESLLLSNPLPGWLPGITFPVSAPRGYA